MTAHTPEPWRSEWQPGQTPNHTYTHCVMYGDDSLCDTLTRADADRIVACVNAMAGIPDPAALVRAADAVRDKLESAASMLSSYEACNYYEKAVRAYDAARGKQ